VERETDRAAFAKAFAYLNYYRSAKWTAYLSAVGTGILFVALLCVLWLFADLMVHRGAIPSFDDLSAQERSTFAESWTDTDRKGELDVFGFAEHYAKMEPTELEKLPSADREWLWRAHLYAFLREKVGPEAAVSILPQFRDLPPFQQSSVQADWAAYKDKDALLDDLNVSNWKADPGNLDPETVWRLYLYRTLSTRDDPKDREAAELLAKQLRDHPTPGDWPADTGSLEDHGVLSLVVRSHVHQRLHTPLLAWVAGWNPWMWNERFGNTPRFVFYLTMLFIIALVLALLRGGLSFLQQEAAARAVVEASTRLRRAVYHHTFRLGTLAFRELGPSEAVSVFIRHVEAVHDALFAWLTVAFREPIKFALVLAFALVVNWQLALAFLLFALLVWLVGGQVAAYFRRQGRAALARASEQLALIRETLMLMRLVKVYLMELFNQSRVERLLSRYAKALRVRYRGEAIYRPLLVFLATMAALVLLAVGGLIVLYGGLGVASAITLATALVSLYWPVENWLNNRKVLRRGRESAAVLFNFLDRPGEVGQVVGAEFLPPLAKQLDFDNVTLREAGSGRLLLDNVSLTIKAGQRVGLVGAEDLEKHALVYLIPRLLDPTSGEIRIDQYNLRWVTLDSLRAQIGIVLQHNLVYHDTVANNIGCGDPAYSLPQIIEASKLAHAHNFVQKLPQGYETPIGEMGHSLTSSEKFRIALARAVLRDPALLIIEEPEIALDDDSKALLDDTFARILPGRTTLFLPHRISTIRSCDQIYFLNKARVEAVGIHRELLSHNPLYRHLHYLEFNEVAEQV
jgi:ATP-binding cassette, subfamily B, bacterial